MSEEKIQRKELWIRLSSIKKQKNWIKAAELLGLRCTRSKGGTAHVAIRLPGYENHDVKGLVTTISDDIRKDVSEKVFKAFVDKGGFTEDEIWKALGFLEEGKY